MQKLPKLPKLFDATGLEAKLTPLAKRILEWSRAVQDYLTALDLFLRNEDFHRADRIGKTELSPRLPTDGQVLTATKAGQAAEWQDAPAGYTDEQAQDAVGGIVGPTTGPYTLIYNDAIPSITLDVDDMVGDSGSGGVKGLVPAPAAGDAAAGKYLKANGQWSIPPGADIPTTETATGNDYGGTPTYIQRFTGSVMPANGNNWITSGVTGIKASGGWVSTDPAGSNVKRAFPYNDGAGNQVDLFVTSAGALRTFTQGDLDGNPYSFWVEYTK